MENTVIPTISLNEQVNLTFKVKSIVASKVVNILSENNFKINVNDTGFEGFYKITIRSIGIKRAELVRVLLKREKIITYS